MLTRWIVTRLNEKLEQSPVVALLGMRQVGKTTTAKAIARTRPSVYLDLESPEDQLKLRDPLSFLRAQQGKLVILDEIQRTPELFQVLRGLIDENREQGVDAGQFLVLGSASMDLLRQSGESLAGRISYLEMGGLNALEIKERDVKKLWLRGGFPNSFLSPRDPNAMDWLEDLIRTYLERDIPQMGFRIPSNRLRRLWTMVAHLQGETLNCSTLDQNLEISGKTVQHYLDVLTDLLLLRRLEPWYVNAKKRLVKTPRYYIRDSGLQHRLLGISDEVTLLANPVMGKSWEGFVLEQIHAVLPPRAKAYFYRTLAGAEVDLVLHLDQQIWAVEIKYGVAPKISKHYARVAQDLGATKTYVIYGGSETLVIENGVTLIPLIPFLKELSQMT